VLDLRNSDRVCLASAEAKLREQAGTSWAVKLLDISPRGFRAAWHFRLTVGERVWLRIAGMEALPAIVRWSRDFEVGCEFERPFHPAVFDHIVRTHL
jgi:PilZ domain